MTKLIVVVVRRLAISLGKMDAFPESPCGVRKEGEGEGLFAWAADFRLRAEKRKLHGDGDARLHFRFDDANKSPSAAGKL